MVYTVVFAPEAQEQLLALYQFIAEQGAPLTAERYTSAIVDYCEAMSTFPKRGTQRDDIRPGLRVTNYQGAAIIAFAVDDATTTVSIIGMFYGGQNFEILVQEELDR
jgi:toxin ParE1/3/4